MALKLTMKTLKLSSESRTRFKNPFDSIMEATSRRAAVEDWYPRHGIYWADVDDDDGGFWEECFLVGSLQHAKDDANADLAEGNETGAVIAISLGSSEPWENIDTTSSFNLLQCLAPRGNRWSAGGGYYQVR